MYRSYSELGVVPDQNVDQYSMRELQNMNEKLQLVRSTPVVCINIHADWCQPCKQSAPSYSLLAQKFSKNPAVAMVKYNYDKMDAQEKTIQSIPLYLIYSQGRLIETVIGADLERVEDILNGLVAGMSSLSSGGSSQGNQVGPQHAKSSIRSHRPADQMYNPRMNENVRFHEPGTNSNAHVTYRTN
jgi:thiol-disulfide isomerase/thioredoxin